MMQRGALDVLTSGQQTAPLAIRLVGRFPFLQGLPARLIGLGIRPEYEAPAPAPLLDPSA